MRMADDFIWSLKYRPRAIEDVVLPEKLKKQFSNLIKKGKIGNILLSGRAGTGKTTSAFILGDTIDADVMYMNLSDETGVEGIRTKVRQFVSSASFGGKKKVFIGDEADRLSNNAQDLLKAEIESFSKNCSFIFTTNHQNRIIEPLKSRMQEIDFGVYTKKELSQAKREFYKSLIMILKKEQVKYEKEAVAQLVNTFFPDMRKCLNETQHLSQQGDITLEVVNENVVSNIEDYFNLVKEKNFTGVRKYIANLSIDLNTFYSAMYKDCHKFLVVDSIPQFILLVAKYQYESSFSIDAEIPLMACSMELMSECEFR